MRKRFLVIHNSRAGVTRRRMLERTCDALQQMGALVELRHADSLAEDEQIARAAIAGGACDAVVAAGGDSTVRGVAAGLAGSDMALGIIPAGTGNVLAEEIGLARDPDAAARCLMQGPAVAIEGGSAAGQVFYEMAGLGFDSRLLARLDVGWKQRIGKLAYAWPILAELATRQPRFEIEIDGALHSCTWAIITKASRYAGGFVLAPDQSVAREGFRAVLIDARSRPALAGVLLALAANAIGRHPAVKVLPCQRARVASSDVPLQLDGEPLAPRPSGGIEIGPSGRRLKLIVPAEFGGRAGRIGQRPAA